MASVIPLLKIKILEVIFDSSFCFATHKYSTLSPVKSISEIKLRCNQLVFHCYHPALSYHSLSWPMQGDLPALIPVSTVYSPHNRVFLWSKNQHHSPGYNSPRTTHCDHNQRQFSTHSLQRLCMSHLLFLFTFPPPVLKSSHTSLLPVPLTQQAFQCLRGFVLAHSSAWNTCIPSYHSSKGFPFTQPLTQILITHTLSRYPKLPCP